jgi:type IV pilus assembly protein PilE
MKSYGFTLIELMVTVAIVGILAAVALPSYTRYIQKGKVVEATNLLSVSRVQLEQYYQDNKNYGSTATACGNNVGTLTGDSFNFSCNWGDNGTSQGFLITATGKNAMNGFQFTVDQDNARKTVEFSGASNLPKDCWIYTSGDSC